MFSIVWSANIKALLCPLLLNPILKFTKHQNEPATNQFGEDCLFKIVRPRLLRLQRAGEQQPDVAGQLRGGRSLPSDAQCGVQLHLPQKGDPGKWPDLTWPDLTWPDLTWYFLIFQSPGEAGSVGRVRSTRGKMVDKGQVTDDISGESDCDISAPTHGTSTGGHSVTQHDPAWPHLHLCSSSVTFNTLNNTGD